MLSIMKINNKNIKSADYKKKKKSRRRRNLEEAWIRAATVVSLYISLPLALYMVNYDGLGFSGHEKNAYILFHLNLHLKIRNLQKTLILVVLDRDQ